jgi:hypothetical protein
MILGAADSRKESAGVRLVSTSASPLDQISAGATGIVHVCDPIGLD